MLSSTVFTLLVFASSIAANPVQTGKASRTLQISRRLNTTNTDVLRHDQTRAKYLKNGANNGNRARASEPLTNTGVGYNAQITVGTGDSAAVYSLVVDTGSSNTWVGANKPYVKTSSSMDTGNGVSVSYGSGSFSGEEYIDTVTLTPALVVRKQSIGAATQSSGFSSGTDGILGIGPQSLTAGTLSGPGASENIPTLTDNLFAQGTISGHSVAISFEPTILNNIVNGEITWGATDPLKYIGPITYGPITSTSPASQYWGVDMSATYGELSILPETAGIVDTGTTLILLASDLYARYKNVTGGVDDEATGLLRFTPAQYVRLSSLTFTFAGTNFKLTANAQTWPVLRNKDIGGSSDYYYGIVSDLGAPSGQGLDFICGYSFLERFYSVYDTANQRVGLADTLFTDTVIV